MPRDRESQTLEEIDHCCRKIPIVTDRRCRRPPTQVDRGQNGESRSEQDDIVMAEDLISGLVGGQAAGELSRSRSKLYTWGPYLQSRVSTLGGREALAIFNLEEKGDVRYRCMQHRQLLMSVKSM